MTPGAFAIKLQRYQAVPWTIGALVAIYLPWLEVLAGAFLLFRKIEFWVPCWSLRCYCSFLLPPWRARC